MSKDNFESGISSGRTKIDSLDAKKIGQMLCKCAVIVTCLMIVIQGSRLL